MEFNEQFRGKRSKEFNILIHGTTDTNAIDLAIPGVLKSREVIGNQLTLYTFESAQIPSQIQFRALKDCSLWGIEFIQENGLIYQQCGVVGAQFTHLLPYKEDLVTMLAWQKPDLVVFSYGTNESYGVLDSVTYSRQVEELITLIQEKIPGIGILITNAPDTRSAGKTPKSELVVNRCLYQIAKQTKTAYYDVNRVMGGWGSHSNWQANDLFLKDQLHFNKKGATLIGQLFSHALLKAVNMGLTQQSSLEQQILQSFPRQAILVTPEISENKTYIVKEGDSLSAIAKKLGTTVEALCKLNGITNPDSLKLGQKISY
ncbi:MAG: LysM peptidoglycan-binding domain-containing protein [Flavobacteriales bacterium]